MNNIVITIPVIPAITITLLVVAVIAKAVRYYKNIKVEKLTDLGIPYGYIKVFPKDLHKVPEGLSCGLAFEEFINLEGIKALLLCIEHSLKQKGMTLEETLKEAKKQKGGAFYGTFKEL